MVILYIRTYSYVFNDTFKQCKLDNFQVKNNQICNACFSYRIHVYIQDELKLITNQLKKAIDLGQEARNETKIMHGQYDTDVNRHMAAQMRHDKNEREQMSILIEHKQSLLREIDWINEQKKIIDNFISKMAPTLDKCLCEGPSINDVDRAI